MDHKGITRPRVLPDGLRRAFTSSPRGPQNVPIEVPPFLGLEPHLALGYSSFGRNGFVGLGWGLSGFSTIERVSPGRGTPRFDANDIYLLDGQDLVPCAQGSVSPSCTTGGTHSTKVESYVRITLASNTWTVWRKDGTRTTFNAVYQTPSGTLWWGQYQQLDTRGNVATYSWAHDNGDYYPASVVFRPPTVDLYGETRPDVLRAAAATASSLRMTRYRGPASLGPGSPGPSGRAGTQGEPGRHLSLVF